MMGQNSFSNANKNSNDFNFPNEGQSTDRQAINSAHNQVASLPSDVHDDSPSIRVKKPNSKIIIVAIVSALVGASVAVGIMLLINNRSTTEEGAEIVIEQSSPDNDGSKTNQEIIDEYDKLISDSSSEEEKFSYTLNKITYYIISEEYDSALTTLNAIDTESLSSDDQYRVYNRYVSLYSSKGDATEAERYQALADEAERKMLTESGAIEQEEQDNQEE